MFISIDMIGRTLIELDREGQILASYWLDCDLSNLSYDLEEQRLYGLRCPQEITLLSMDLPDAVSGEIN